jgi:2',3'-cyclic-nucleotide 2'-phosphodiesterase (5'-nucleotidase family)
VKEIQENKKGILVLDVGDLLFKKFSNPIPENELNGVTQKAHLIIDSLNWMGYDAMGIGEDDLSLGKEFLLNVSKKANFPLLSSNLFDKETEKPLFQPYLLKEINGLRIGIFSLLSPDFFLGPSDLRRKGVIVRPPIETVQNMVRELQPKTDLIILLSHLGYPKDIELAQTGPGIHFIFGGHLGMNLSHPPIIKNTVILQTAPKGMYAGRLDLILYNNEPTFYNSATKRDLENRVNILQHQLASAETPEAQKSQWHRAKEESERTLKKLIGKNEFTITILPLQEQMKEHPDIKILVDTYKAQFPVTGTSSPSK